MRRATILGLALGLTACSGVATLDRPVRPLEGSEPAVVRKRVDEALEKKEWALAWNMEVQAGGDRDRLEAIAMAALEAGSGDAEDMLEELRRKHGGLTPAARARVRAVAAKFEAAGEWEDAAEVEVIAAEDPPRYEAAWDVYERAPVDEALGVLELIQKSRRNWEEAHPESARKGGK